MEEQTVSFGFEARYYRSGPPTGSAAQVLFVLHGYGQLAQFFMRKFQFLEAHDIRVIAPEGLSRFYLEKMQPGSGRASDRVGATWMTKENREMDIRNYIAYLDSIYSRETAAGDVPVTILGFSQGAATACRWALSPNIRFEKLVLWSGVFPPDMNVERSSTILKNKKITLAYGTRDPFLQDERFASERALIQKLGLTVNEVSFDGEHDIEPATLLRVLADA